MKTISIIIPVYNEVNLIAKTIEAVLAADTLGLKKEVIIVDDASTDGTKKSIQKLEEIYYKNKSNHSPLTTIHFSKNMGKGAALKAGFEKSSGDVLIIQDADGEYFVKDYPALLAPFLKEKTIVVYGSRNKKREKFHNRYSYLSFFIGGLFLTWFINLLYNLALTDHPTGYKLFSKKVKKILLQPEENGFSYEVAVTALLSKKGYNFQEVPIHYTPRSMQEGKKINALDFIDSIFVAMKYKFIG
jgi:glycosyltransferase involved in cell wall biosynthesis